MHIGYSQICINPIKPTVHVGFFIDMNPLINVRGDLYARCLRLKDEDHNIVLLSFDSLGITADIQKLFVERLNAALGEEAEYIFCSTHTHYAPALCNLLDFIKVDKTYLEYTLSKVAILVKNCRITEKAVSVAYSWETFNKVGRTRINNKSDKNIYAGVLSFFDEQTRIGNLVFYNCHPTTPQTQANYFTSAYPGSALETLTKRYPSEFFMFLQGADGDVSTRLTRRNNHYEEVTRLGNEMARIFSKLMLKNDSALKQPLALDFQDGLMTIHNQLKDLSRFSEAAEADMTDKEKKVLKMGRTYIATLKDKFKPHESNIEISTLRLGPYLMLFTPFEFFTDYNDYIDKDRTLLVCYSQGLNGYLTQPDNQHLSYEYCIELQTEEDKRNVIELIRGLNG